MKISDFAPRTGVMETYLTGINLCGVEVGADVGAHAESILTHCSIKYLCLVDLWENKWCEGYCEGRLARWRNRIEMCKGKSNEVVEKFGVVSLDFIYLDQQHDYISVREDFKLWWPVLKTGGVMALRNYSEANKGLKLAADEFVTDKRVIIDSYLNELLIFK